VNLRIAIGRCNCSKPYTNPIQELACQAIETRLNEWRGRLPADLAALPAEYYEVERVEGHWIRFATHRRTLDDGATLVVFAALVHTWRWPTYISLGCVGRIYAEGLVVKHNGNVEIAPDRLMWAFR
jgi:hypothetical protein